MTAHANIAKSLSALGHEVRLDIFRLLVRAGDDGLSVGQITTHLELAPSTVAHHVRALVGADLLLQEKHGREVLTRVNFDQVHETVQYLTAECCVGVTLTNTAENAA